MAMLIWLVKKLHAAGVVNSISYRELESSFSLKNFPLDESKENLEKMELDSAH